MCFISLPEFMWHYILMPEVVPLSVAVPFCDLMQLFCIHG